MALITTITYISKSGGSQLRVGFKCVPSGNYTTGGDVLNLATAAQDAAFVGLAAAVEALGAPLALDVWSNNGNITTFYVPIAGTNPSNNKLKVATALGAEATGGAAYPASAIADIIVGEATFNNL